MPAPPMPQYDVPDLVKIELHMLQDNQKVMNRYWVRNSDGPPDDVKLHLIANTFKNWWTTDLHTYVSNTVSLFEVTAQTLSPEGVAVLETTDLPVSGNRASAALPNNVSLAVHWGTGFVGRFAHGRTYHIGLTQDMVTGNNVNPTDLAGLKDAYEALRTTLDNAVLNLEFSVVSFVLANAWRTIPISIPISGVAIEGVIDSMRRRLPGRGQ